MKNCVRCGKAIPPERLEVLPETQLCVRCSQAVGGDFITFTVKEVISKPGSLKKNYGGYSLAKVPRRIVPLSAEERAKLDEEQKS